jgi:hypothetical protein
MEHLSCPQQSAILGCVLSTRLGANGASLAGWVQFHFRPERRSFCESLRRTWRTPVTSTKNTQRSPARLAGPSQSRPAEFPIGSLASRAAARLLAQEKRQPRKPPMTIIKVTDLNAWLSICKVPQPEVKSDYYIQFEWAGRETAAEIRSARAAMLVREGGQTESDSKGLIGYSSEPSL